MSVIQNIRSKYIGLVVAAIIVALVGFLIMDAMQSNVRSVFGEDNTLLAKVNGNRIDYKKFEEKRAMYEENMRSRSPEGTLGEQEKSQAQDQAYTDMVNDILFQGEIDQLGLDLTDAELRDMLTGQFIDPTIRQSFTDPKTGQFDPNSVSQHLSSLGQDKTGEKRRVWENFQNEIIKSKIRSKYTDMITKGIYIPKYILEREANYSKSVASVNYVAVPYSSISDSAVNVTDKEVEAFIAKRENLFKVRDDNAKADYVAFDIIPSSEDTANSLGVLNKLVPELTTTTDPVAFVAQHSEETGNDRYFTESSLQMPNPAEVINAGTGAVIGPVFMNGAFKLVKVLEKRTMADSASAAHILVGINENRSEEAAKKLIDSLEVLVKGGVPLGALAAQYSDDPGSKDKGGVYESFPQGQMVPEFNDVCFNGKVGDLKVVKTQFGYHLIKVLAQKAFKPAVKVAMVTKMLQAGTATTQAAFAKASSFVTKAKDAKSFEETAKSLKMDKRVAEGITKAGAQIQGLGNAREVARWAFQAKIGDVSQVFNLNDKYIVAVLTGRKNAGELMDAKSVKPQLEAMIKREKKAAMLIDKYKGKNSLEELATATGSQIKTADTLKMSGGGSGELAYELRAIGAAFNKANLNKVTPAIIGDQGVYFLYVKQVGVDATAPVPSNEEQSKQMLSQFSSVSRELLPYVLKYKAKIVDNRGNFF